MSKFAVYFDDATGRLKRVQNFRYDSTSNAFQFYNSASTRFFAIKANDSITTDTTLTAPPTAPVAGAFMRTDADGNLAWAFNNYSRTEYNFDVTAPGGQYQFDAPIPLTGKYVRVFLNGVLQREGFLYDYEKCFPNATSIRFINAVPQNAWVRFSVEYGATPENYDSVGSSNSIACPWDLTTGFIEVYINGVLQRQGISNDWYITGVPNTIVLTQDVLTANSWKRVVFYSLGL